MPDPIPKVLKIILAVVALLVIFLWHLNSSYVADIIACRVEDLECTEVEVFTANVIYDTMDGLYYINKLYVYDSSEELKLKDFCLVRESEKYFATCEDEKGNSWNITLIELKL